eukprot:7062850-Pyramimonas_sp.AAC.1
MPDPIVHVDWECSSLPESGPSQGCLGSPDEVTVVFGDASGGADTADPRLRRVALGIATLSS